MPGFERNAGSLLTVQEDTVEVLELASTAEGGEEREYFSIPEDTVALMVVTEGEGTATLRINGDTIRQVANETEFAVSEGRRLRAYVNTSPTPGQGELTLAYERGNTFRGRIIRVTRGGFDRLAKQVRDNGKCWTCKKLVRSAITAALAALGLPDLSIGEDILEVIGLPFEELADHVPQAVQRLLDQLFGSSWRDIFSRLRGLLDYLPFDLAATELCKMLGFCR